MPRDRVGRARDPGRQTFVVRRRRSAQCRVANATYLVVSGSFAAGTTPTCRSLLCRTRHTVLPFRNPPGKGGGVVRQPSAGPPCSRREMPGGQARASCARPPPRWRSAGTTMRDVRPAQPLNGVDSRDVGWRPRVDRRHLPGADHHEGDPRLEQRQPSHPMGRRSLFSGHSTSATSAADRRREGQPADRRFDGPRS